MALPPNWTRYETDEGKAYFHNAVTNVTQWDTPAWPTGQDNALSSVSASEVFTYNPTDADLDASASAVFGDGGGRVTGKAIGPLSSPVGGESELVSLTGAAVPSGRIGAAPAAGGSSGSSGQGGGSTGFFGGLGLDTLTGAVGAPGEGSQGWLLTAAQSMFDVSTEDIVARLKLALKPYPPPSAAAKQELRDRPDFYGPFWVATTAVLFLAATGNFARLLAVGDHTAFKADYSLVSMAAGLVYGFLLAVPLIARTSLCFASEEVANVDFKQLICVCGYSLAPAIPVSLLCLIPLESLRWIAVLTGLAMSLLFVRHHYLSDIHVTTPWLKWTLLGLPCAMPVAVFFLYRVHFFSSRP